MKLNDKLKKIRELDKVMFPTPDQIEERLRLDEEVELELRDSGLHLDQFNNQEQSESIFETSKQDQPELKKKKMTIYEKFIKPRLKGKPMTWDEVQQLKLEALGTRLKRHIAEDKAKMRKAKADRLNSIFSMVTGERNSSRTTTKSKKGSKKEDDDLHSLLGSNDPSKYDKLVKK